MTESNSYIATLRRPRWEFDMRIDGSGRSRAQSLTLSSDVIIVQLAINWSKWQPLGPVYTVMIYRT